MGFLSELKEKLLLEVSIDQLRRDWVEAGKIDADLFEFLVQCAGNQSAYATWLVKRIGSHDNDEIKSVFQRVASSSQSDAVQQSVIETYRESFEFFTKYKQYFEKKDINQYKTLEDFVAAFREVKKKVEEKKKSKDIDRFKIGAVQLEDGTGYLVYKLPKGHPENRQISVELGRHPGGYRGWCTAYDDESVHYWDSHIAREDLYIFINPNDRLRDKYQIQFGYNDGIAFPIKTDAPVSSFTELIRLKPFYDFLHEKEDRPYPQKFAQLAETKELLDYVNQHEGEYDENFEIAPGIISNLKHPNATPKEYLPTLVTIMGQSAKERLLRLALAYNTAANQSWQRIACSGHSTTPYFCIRLSDNTYMDFRVSTRTGRLEIYYGGLGENTGSYDRQRVRGCAVKDELYEKIKIILEYLHSSGYPDIELYSGYTRDFVEQIRAERDRERQQRAAIRAANRTGVRRQPVASTSTGTRVPTPAIRSNESLEVSEEYRVATAGSSTFYCVPENNQVLQTLGITSIGHAGIVKQGNILVILSNLRNPSESLYENVHRVDATTGNRKSNRINPDLLWRLYDIFDRNVPEIAYPTKIQAIEDIKRGRYSNYQENPVHGSTIYKLPGNIIDRSTFPYGLPSSWNRYVILGYILSCQFTLSDTGELSVTGRWGTGNSGSAISCLGGLSRVLLALCDRYDIPRRGAIQQLQEIYKNCNIPCPKIITEALKEDSPENLTELKALYSQVLKSEGGDKVLNEGISFNQYKAMVLFKFNTDKTKKLGSEKLAEMVRALPGATRVSPTSANKENGEVIMSVRLISQKPPKEAFVALKKNALEKFAGNILDVKVAGHSIETKSFVK